LKNTTIRSVLNRIYVNIYILTKRRKLWIWLGLLSIAIHFILTFIPEFTEAVYSRGIYSVVRYMLDYTVGWLPFSLAYILTLFVVFLLVRSIANMFTNWLRFGLRVWKTELKKLVLSWAAFAGATTFFFYLFWGYNLARVPLDETLNINTRKLSRNELLIEANYARKMAIEARRQVPNATDKAFGKGFLPNGLEDKMRANMEKVLDHFGYPTPGRIRCRHAWPQGFLKSMRVSGIYVPFTGEAHVDQTLSPILTPLTMAHEMAHGFGFTSEAEANFLAYLACEISEDPRIIYSGRITLLIYITHELWFVPMVFQKGILADLREYGIFGHDSSYSKMILLVAAWRRSKHFPLKID
jgi:hypothetical protein